MKKPIISTLENVKNENITDHQSVQEYLKYEIRNFSKKFSKEAARSNEIFNFRNKVKNISLKSVIETVIESVRECCS